MLVGKGGVGTGGWGSIEEGDGGGEFEEGLPVDHMRGGAVGEDGEV